MRKNKIEVPEIKIPTLVFFVGRTDVGFKQGLNVNLAPSSDVNQGALLLEDNGHVCWATGNWFPVERAYLVKQLLEELCEN